ncbi:ABC transporter substrate-binding protein [Rhizobium sp. BR 314]|uniref:ABC transporter substrate-binding protein n=1 Tax=Rhizobium sp. BR 314 TaxID=3040013 RepID=UPI0039BF43F0
MTIHFGIPKLAQGIAGALSIAVLVAVPARAEDIPTPAKDESLHAQLPQAVRDRGVLRVVSTFGYAPQQFYGDDGKTPQGLSVDLGNALGAVVGERVEFTNTAFDSIIPGLEAGRFDMAIAAMSVTFERGAKVNFIVYENTGAQLLVRAGNPKNINSLTDICGINMIELKGSLYNQVIEHVSDRCVKQGKNAIHIDTIDNSDSVFQAVTTGRADATYADSSPLVYMAKLSEGRLQVTGPQYPDIPYGIAIAGENTGFAKVMGAALDKLIKDGTYKAILAKWGLGFRAADAAAVTPVGSPASAYPPPPSAVDIAFGK